MIYYKINLGLLIDMNITMSMKAFIGCYQTIIKHNSKTSLLIWIPAPLLSGQQNEAKSVGKRHTIYTSK